MIAAIVPILVQCSTEYPSYRPQIMFKRTPCLVKQSLELGGGSSPTSKPHALLFFVLRGNRLKRLFDYPLALPDCLAVCRAWLLYVLSGRVLSRLLVGLLVWLYPSFDLIKKQARLARPQAKRISQAAWLLLGLLSCFACLVRRYRLRYWGRGCAKHCGESQSLSIQYSLGLWAYGLQRFF